VISNEERDSRAELEEVSDVDDDPDELRAAAA
jgi:hypothetical protein